MNACARPWYIVAATAVPPWAILYGTFITTMCVMSIFYMRHALILTREQATMIQQALSATVIAAANMWDTLTPEQIRTLHPRTVDVANGLPSWREIQETIREAQEAWERSQEPPNESENEP